MSSHSGALPDLPPLDGHGEGSDSTGRAKSVGADPQATQSRLPVVPATRNQTKDAMGARPWPPTAPTSGEPRDPRAAAPEPWRSSTNLRIPVAHTASTADELSVTTQRRALRKPAGGWDAMASMLSDLHEEGAPVPGDAPAGEDTAHGAWLRQPLDLGEGALERARDEYAKVRGELDELRLLMRQNTAELEKLNQRKVLAAARVREIEEHIELHSRQDIRTAYLTASEAEMRVLMITEQQERLETKLQVFEHYEQVLSRLIGTLIALQAVEQAPPRYMERVTSGSLPAITRGASMAGWREVVLGDLSGDAHAREVAALSRVIEAQEHERKRVAQRLHDGPAQSLANIVLTAEICEKLFQADPRRALTELANLKGMVTANLQETRKYIFELRPMALDDLGLVATLRRYAADAGAQHRVQVQLSAPQGERPLPKEIEVPVFRVAQEAITNALQHSRATIVQVSVALPTDGLVLVVEDNGRGFDVEDALQRAVTHQTRGIVSMQERAEILGGWLRLESLPGRGSRVELSIPLHVGNAG